MFPKLPFTLFALFTLLVGMTAFAGTNPFLPSADAVVSCPNDGSQFPTFRLCGANDARSIQINDPLVLSAQWQLLDGNSCATGTQNCPNLGMSCTWNTIATGNSLNLNNGGEYRVLLTYASAPNEIHYAKAIQTTYADVLTVMQPISANGGSNGIIELSVTGDSGPYMHQLYRNGTLATPFQSSPTFSGLSVGMYQISTRDSSGICEHYSAMVDLTEPEELLAQLIQTQAPSCAEGGTVEVNVSGGEAPYQYSLNGGAYMFSNTFTNLPVGSYSAQVLDVNGLSAMTNGITITDGTPLMVNYTVQDVTCNGMQDGLILVEPNGGSGNYQYQLHIDGITNPYQSSNVFEGLAPGFYDIFVMDSGGCVSESNTIAVYEPAPLVLEYATTSASDNNSPDGAITLTASGGGGAYEYSIDGGVTFSTSNVFENLIAGQYQVAAIDGFVCLVEQGTVEVASASQLTLNATIQNQITCTSNARIVLTPTGGVPPYEYSSNGSSYRTTNPFITGSTGNTTFTVRDATGAMATSNAVLITATPESISVNVGTSYDCNGVNQPRVDFQLTRGSENIQYSIYDGIWQSETTFVDVPDGTYTARAKNDSCERQFIITVENVTPVRVRLLEQNEGWARFQILSGKAPYDYRIDGYSSPRVSIGSETIFEVDGLSPGPHWLVVDAANCSDHVSVDIEGFIPELEILTEVTNSTCSGDSDGAISVTGVGGLGEYNYGLVDGENNIIYPVRPETSNFEGLAPGTYQALLRDVTLGQLVRSELITITATTQLTLDISPKEITCNGAQDGSITAAAQGGDGIYSFQLSDSEGNILRNFQTSGLFESLNEGRYVIDVTDSSGCTGTSLVYQVREAAVFIVDNISSQGDTYMPNTGSISFDITGGAAPYSYSINSSAFVSFDETNITITDLAAGDQIVNVRDVYGCELIFMQTIATTDAVVPLTADIFITNSSCAGSLDGSILVDNTQGGSGNYVYAFDTTDITQAQTSNIFKGIAAGSHYVAIFDSSGYMKEIAFDLTSPEVLEVTAEVRYSEDTATITVSAQGGTLPYSYFINGSESQEANFFENLSPGRYLVQIHDAKGCISMAVVVIEEKADTESQNIDVIQNPGRTEVIDIVFKETQNSETTIAIYNSRGNRVFSSEIDQGTSQTQIDVSNLSRGIYFIYIKNAELEEIKKVMIL